MSMSSRLQELRQKAQLSQEDLAERIGVSRQAISKWESEQSNPDIENIIRLSEVYNISTDYILKGTQPTVTNTPRKKSEYTSAYKTLIAVGGIAAISTICCIVMYLLVNL